MEQQQLVAPPRPALRPSRPREKDADVIQEAVKVALPRFIEYCESGGGETRGLDEDLTALLGGFYTDGYAMARRLEREFHWAEDRELVDLCDGLGNALCDAHRKIVKEWIDAFNVQPRFKIDTLVYVVVPCKKNDRIQREKLEGTITAVDEARGEYTVYVPYLGHVRAGLGTHGVILAWEAVEAVND